MLELKRNAHWYEYELGRGIDWSFLPPHLVRQVTEFLESASDVVGMMRSSKGWHQACVHPSVWQTRVYQEYPEKPIVDWYEEPMKAFLRYRREEIERALSVRRLQREHRALERRRHRRMLAAHSIARLLIFILTPVLLLLLPLLSREEATVQSPVLYVVLTVLGFFLAHVATGRPEDWLRRLRPCFSEVRKAMPRFTSRQHAALTGALCLSCFATMASLRLGGALDSSWALIAVPGGFSLAVCLMLATDGADCTWRHCVGVLAAVVPNVAMAVLRLNGWNISLTVILAPLFVAYCVLLMGLRRSRWQEEGRWTFADRINVAFMLVFTVVNAYHGRHNRERNEILWGSKLLCIPFLGIILAGLLVFHRSYSLSDGEIRRVALDEAADRRQAAADERMMMTGNFRGLHVTRRVTRISPKELRQEIAAAVGHRQRDRVVTRGFEYPPDRLESPLSPLLMV